MAILAKAPYGSSMGMGQNQLSVVSQYTASYTNNKSFAGAGSQTATFLSPTESEFSEPSDGQDSVGYVQPFKPAVNVRLLYL